MKQQKKTSDYRAMRCTGGHGTHNRVFSRRGFRGQLPRPKTSRWKSFYHFRRFFFHSKRPVHGTGIFRGDQEILENILNA